MTTAIPEPLPGLETEREVKGSQLHGSIRRTIKALHEAEHVGEVDAARLALALRMADVIELKIGSGRMSTIGNDARVLMELLDNIKSDADDVDDDLRNAIDEWNKTTA